MSAPQIVETRVIRWIARGYEDSFTQYQVTDDGALHICQIALRDNLARALMGVPSVQRHRSAASASLVANRLIENRLEDGAAEEVATEDAR